MEETSIDSKLLQITKQLNSLKLGIQNNNSEVVGILSDIKSLQKTFKSLSEDIKDIQSMKNMYSEVTALKLHFQDQILQLQRSTQDLINSCNTALQVQASQLLELSKINHGTSREVPELLYVHFSGNPKETKCFIYFIREKLHERAASFPSKKAKINWVVRHFRNSSGNFGDSCASYNWWMALLFENACVQGLRTEWVSVEDPYVIPALATVRDFLLHLESVFDNKHDNEDTKK